MIRTNKDKLPILAVQGQIWHSKGRSYGTMTPDGELYWVPGTGGITFNAQIGDICTGWVADHLEPGVTTRHTDEAQNTAYNMFSCIGNEAIVKSGDAKGDKGFVTGKHGGAEHVMVYFPPETLEKLSIEDKIGVKAVGQGMAMLDYPDIMLRNMSPALFEKMNITPQGEKLKVGVAKILPAAIMGSGLGMSGTATGDYDITLFDRAITEKHGLDDLRFGDIVAITDADTRYGRTYRTGAVTIGVIIHGDCLLPGHGPGVTTLMSCKLPLVEPFIDEGANLKNYFLG